MFFVVYSIYVQLLKIVVVKQEALLAPDYPDANLVIQSTTWFYETQQSWYIRLNLAGLTAAMVLLHGVSMRGEDRSKASLSSKP